MSDDTPAMTSNRPYLLRAMYEWIGDNGMTPYLLVDAGHEQLQCPPQAVQDGRIVLNIAGRAVSQLDLGNDSIRFKARFSGASHQVVVPLAAVQAIYAQESGQGMMLPDEDADLQAGRPAPARDGDAVGGDDDDDGSGPGRRGSHLRVVK